MKATHLLWITGVAALLAGIRPALPLSPVTNDDRKTYEESARITSRTLPRMHLLHNEWGDDVATNAMEILLSALDPDRSVFLASDVAGFRKRAPELDDRLRSGDLSAAYEIYDTLMARLSNRVDYVRVLLDKGFDLQRTESFRWKRRDAEWPSGEKEWNELWRKKIQNQVVARVVARDLVKEELERKRAAGDPSATNEPPEELLRSPEEGVLKEFDQQLSMLQDNDANWLLTLYINSFAHAYDPHSDFMSKNNTEDFDIQMKLSLVGIGAILGVEDGAAKVNKLIAGGPAERDGRLKAGDKIIAVAQGDTPPVDILHWPLSKSVRLIRGEKGTKVVLTVIPATDSSGTSRTRIALIRDEVKLEDQAARGILRTIPSAAGRERTLGVITIPDFYADISGRNSGAAEARSVSRDVRRILGEFRTNGVEGIALDLRNNGGGLLNEAVELTGLFINRGPVVQVRSSFGVQVLRDPEPGVAVYDGPLLTLINRQSASAAEIVAGALKDYGRSILVGDSKTHGKGTVQSMLRLDDSRPQLGTLKLTTASFYRINGQSTQLEGITPHIEIPSILEQMEIGEEYLPHALPTSQVRPAFYHPDRRVENSIPALRELSDLRLEKNPKYQVYSDLLDRLGQKKQSEEIALDYPSRMKLARSEKELADLMKSAEPLDAEGSGSTNRMDVVLEESLKILADFIDLQASTNPPTAAAHVVR